MFHLSDLNSSVKLSQQGSSAFDVVSPAEQIIS